MGLFSRKKRIGAASPDHVQGGMQPGGSDPVSPGKSTLSGSGKTIPDTAARPKTAKTAPPVTTAQAKTSKTAKTAAQMISHPTLGDIVVSKNPRARRITVSVRPPGTVRLTLPRGVSLAEGMGFLETKSEWVARARERVLEKSRQAPVVPPYSTRMHTLAATAAPTDNIKIRIAAGTVSVTYPHSLELVSEPVQAAIKKGLEEAWRIEAKQLLPARLEHIARTLGFRYGKVAIRNTRSKWGSCTARNDISLSIHLMRLPDHLIDYILVHELCHTVHKNHGPQFHALLDKLTSGRHLQLRKELRGYTTR